jgi:hypothetical protein
MMIIFQSNIHLRLKHTKGNQGSTKEVEDKTDFGFDFVGPDLIFLYHLIWGE